MAEETIELGAEQLPFSLEAEQSVLGAILIEPECISRVLELLTPDSFYRPQHKQLFTIMLGMFTAAQPIDLSPCSSRQRRTASSPATGMPRSI